MSMKKNSCHPKDRECVAKKMEFLDNPERRGDIPPEILLNMLPIKKAKSILDVGAGTGYLTIPAAKRVSGPVYAIDIDTKMLDIINIKAGKEKLTNIKTVEGIIDAIPLPDKSIDIALASIVLHEVKELAKSLQEIKRVLSEDGLFVCIEFEKKNHQNHTHPRIASSEMEEAIKNVGLKVIEKLYPTDSIYIIMAQK